MKASRLLRGYAFLLLIPFAFAGSAASQPLASPALAPEAMPSLLARAQADTFPGVRDAHTAIYDPVRDRMIVFGGWNSVSNFRDVWALSMGENPVWTKLDPTGTPPAVRRYHSAVYDPVRDRMIVFGGFTGDLYVNDVWALSLGDTMAWTQLTPEGTPPGPRYRQSAIYDPVRDRIVIYGGWFSGVNLGDTWALSLGGTPAWTDITPAGTNPPARFSLVAIYDPVRDRMVISQGADEGYRSDTWALSLADPPAWTEITPGGSLPLGRYVHGAVYDSLRDRMVVFGGYDILGYRDEVLELTLGDSPTWTLLAPAGTPPAGRFGHTAILDPVRNRMTVFAGFNTTGFFNDTWNLSLGDTLAWSPMFPPPAPPVTHQLTVTADHGHVTATPSSADGTYPEGTAVLLTATPDEGYVFLDYSGAVAAATDTVTVLMTGDEAVTADFAEGTLGVPGFGGPATTALRLVTPNPFRGSETVVFSLAHAGLVDLAVFSVDGRRLRTLVHEYREAGEYRAAWDGRDDDGHPAASGVYFERLDTVDGPRTRVVTYLH